MAFVLPAGDYERALRMAGASNFMEALEAGVDRGMRRREMRASADRARELYDRQKSLESANLQAELEKIGEGAFTAQQAGRMAAAPTVTSGSSVPIATQAAVQAVAQDIAQDAAGAAPAVASPTAAALADAVVPAPAVAVQAPQNRRVVFDEGSTVVGGGSPLLGPELPPGYSPPQRQYTQQELALGTPSPAATYGPRRPVGVVTDDPSPDTYEVWRAPYVVDTASLPPEEFALATPRGEGQLGQALRLLEQGRAVDAQEVLGTTGKAYPPLDVETATEGSPIPFGAAPPPDSELPGEPLRGSLEDIAEKAGVLGADFERVINTAAEYRKIGRLDVADALEEYADTQIPREQLSGGETPAAPAGGGSRAVGLPAGGPGDYATQAAAGQTAAPRWGQPGGLSFLEAYPYAQAMAGGGALPGAGAMAGASTADQRMSGAVRGEPVKEEAASPLQAAVSQQAAVAEQVELAGPEPEAVKADQTVDVAGKSYTVKKGDTLGRVSSSFGAPLASVVAANQDVLAPGGKPRQIKRGGKVVLEGQDLIYAGDKIRIPTGEGRESGGEAGPIDPRPVPTTTGPGGQVTSSEGVLARVQRANKTNAQVKAALEKEQQKTPDLPLNPFQKFGRSIDYTPSVRAVAFATQRAQQGDFTMLNQMAGREVRYSELPGLFARYSDFVLGAKGRAKEVYLQQELLKETQANEAKQKALVGVQAMALTQFSRAGYTDEDAQVFAGHYADLYAADPQQARAWSTSLNSMGTDRAKAEAARLKRSGFRSQGISSKDLKELRKERRAQTKDRAAIAGRMESALREAQLMGGEEQIAAIKNSDAYQLLEREYRAADAMVAELNRALGYTEDTDDDDGEPTDYASNAIANQTVIDLAKRFSGDMDSFESGVEGRLKAAGDPNSAENAKLVREHFEKGAKKEAAPTSRKEAPGRRRKPQRPPAVVVGPSGEVTTVPYEEEYASTLGELVEGGVEGLRSIAGQDRSTTPKAAPRAIPAWASEGPEYLRYWRWLSRQPGQPSRNRPTSEDLARYRRSTRG